MATLEKIRKKSVLLIVIIGAALLAFILGDALTNGRTLFGSGTTVAELGDAKVDINEYQQRQQMLQAMSKNNNQNVDEQELAQQAIDDLLDEKLLDMAADKLGIEVSDEMVTFFIMDQPLTPVQRFVGANAEYFAQINPNMTQENFYNVRYWYNVIFTPEKYGVKAADVAPLKQNWLVMEKETKEEARRFIYQNLLVGLVQPNALEKQSMFDGRNDATTIDLAVKRFDDLSKYKVTDAELKAEYEQRKNEFKVNETTKTVSFLSYQIVPSDADKKNARKLQDAAVASLQKGEKLGKDVVKAGVHSDKLKLSASAMSQQDPLIANFMQNAPVDSVGVFDRNGSFELVRVINNSAMANDGVELVALQVMKDSEQALRDALKGGLSIDSVAGKFAADKVMMQPAQNIALQNPEQRGQLPADLAAQLDTVAAGALINVQSAAEGSVLAYVKSVKPQVPVYEIERVSYTLYPSHETIEAASTALAKYASANSNPAKFGANAAKAGYKYQTLAVTGSTPGFPAMDEDRMILQSMYYPMASKLISWAITDAAPGNISEVVYNENSQQPYIYIAMLENECEEFIPYNDSYVKSTLETAVKTRKAGDEMVKQYSGKGDINATAQAMGVSVYNDEEVSFLNGGRFIQDGKVLARIDATKPSQKVVLTKGKDGVYAFVVKAKTPSTVRMDNKAVKALENEYKSKYLGGKRLSQMLRGNDRKENNLFEMTGAR